MYWTDFSTDKIQRANVDGSDIEDVIVAEEGGQLMDLSLDTRAGKLYWVQRGFDVVFKANLDGSEIDSVFVEGLVEPRGIEVNHIDREMYWTDAFTGLVRRSDLSGSAAGEQVLADSLSPVRVAYSPDNDKIYWTNTSPASIRRASSDGSQLEAIVAEGVLAPYDIVVDAVEQKIYWTDIGSDTILRANLDGSEREDLEVDIFGSMASMALLPSGFVPIATEEPEASYIPSFVLSQNYPNPFRNTTSFEYRLPEPGFVQVVVYDVLRPASVRTGRRGSASGRTPGSLGWDGSASWRVYGAGIC